MPNVYAAAAGIELLQTARARGDRARRSTVSSSASSAGARARGFDVVTPDDAARARAAGGRARRPTPPRWSARLEGRGIIASARGTGLRVSFHAYNNDEDVDAVLEALDADAALVDAGPTGLEVVRQLTGGASTTAVASISTSAPGSTRPATTTTDIAGKCRPMTSR